MDEKEYKATYNRVNELRCVYEKAQCSLVCACSKGKMLRLADRLAFGCLDPSAQKQCAELIELLRNKSRFVFKLNEIDGPLPHNKEIRVQNGGLLGLQKLVDEQAEQVADVHQVIEQVVAKYGSIEQLPFDQLMQSITAFKARPKRRSK